MDVENEAFESRGGHQRQKKLYHEAISELDWRTFAGGGGLGEEDNRRFDWTGLAHPCRVDDNFRCSFSPVERSPQGNGNILEGRAQKRFVPPRDGKPRNTEGLAGRFDGPSMTGPERPVGAGLKGPSIRR